MIMALSYGNTGYLVEKYDVLHKIVKDIDISNYIRQITPDMNGWVSKDSDWCIVRKEDNQYEVSAGVCFKLEDTEIIEALGR